MTTENGTGGAIERPHKTGPASFFKVAYTSVHCLDISATRRLETRRLNSRGGATLFMGRNGVTRGVPFSTTILCAVDQSRPFAPLVKCSEL